MIIDTSAIMAILLEEPGWKTVRQALHDAPFARMAAPTLVELHIVARGRDAEFTSGVDAMLERYGVEIVPFSRAHAELARLAYFTHVWQGVQFSRTIESRRLLCLCTGEGDRRTAPLRWK